MKQIQWKHLESNFSNDSAYDDYNYDDNIPEDGVISGDFISGDVYQDVDFTPMGIFHKNDMLNPMKHFDFWIGYTNFRITQVDKEKIQSADGVDFFMQWTPYSFFMVPAELFESSDVKLNIEASLLDEQDLVVETFTLHNHADQKQELETIYEKLDESYGYWIAYSFKNDDNLDCTFVACDKDDSINFKTVLDMCSTNGSDELRLSESINSNEFYKKDQT